VSLEPSPRCHASCTTDVQQMHHRCSPVGLLCICGASVVHLLYICCTSVVHGVGAWGIPSRTLEPGGPWRLARVSPRAARWREAEIKGSDKGWPGGAGVPASCRRRPFGRWKPEGLQRSGPAGQTLAVALGRRWVMGLYSPLCARIRGQDVKACRREIGGWGWLHCTDGGGHVPGPAKGNSGGRGCS
jgi:hypothetical protein